MKGVEGSYSIRQVAEMTGLSTQLIRKWEERYQLVHPRRLENGYRIYNDQDIANIQRVQSLVEQGFTVKNALLSLQKKEQVHPLPHPAAQLQPDQATQALVARLLDAGGECNEHQLTYLLQRATHEYPLTSFLHTILLPFLQEIGDRWECGEWSEFQEHIASQCVRDFLVQMRRSLRENPNGPLLLGSCLPHELHEIPLHMILLQAVQVGWRTIFLQASPALGAIEQAVQLLKPDRVVLSALTTEPFTCHPTLLEDLDQFAVDYPQTDFYIGGTGVYAVAKNYPLQALHVSNQIADVLWTPH